MPINLVIKKSPDKLGYQLQRTELEENKWPFQRMYAEKEGDSWKVYQYTQVTKWMPRTEAIQHEPLIVRAKLQNL